MTQATRSDARVSSLEVSFVATTMHVASHMVPRMTRKGGVAPFTSFTSTTCPPGSWEQLDVVNAREDPFFEELPDFPR